MIKKKLNGMNIKKKLNYGYKTVIMLMMISGVFAIIGLGILFASLRDYINGAEQADQAVKICQIDVNIAARNIREMALSKDSSAYDTYKNAVYTKLEEVDSQLKVMKETGLVEESLYNEYSQALSDWGTIGNDIITLIVNGNDAEATEKILNECAPALDRVVEISDKIDVITDDIKAEKVTQSYISFIGAAILIVVFIVLATVAARKIGNQIVESITTPLDEIEKVANELTKGNLHSTLEYHSEDEIGSVAHNLRKSIRILGTYVDDISRAMQEFSNGNFDVQPEVEWKGDFQGILDGFMLFEKSMAKTVKEIQSVADEVASGSEQVSQSSMNLAEGATDQASITEELAATIESVSEQVSQNAGSAKEISADVEKLGDEIVVGNGKMQEMVQSMSEINEASQQIGKIIATINDIASQTNLLALNASIEAARAGEAGKGFAVVADQVSVLASQSSDAAKESTILIDTSVQAVEKGMVIADETAKQLEHVVTGSKEITQQVNGVADALAAQTEAFDQINDGVDHINEVVQSNSATSQECAAASQEMNGQAEKLKDLIRGFKVGKF